MDIRSGADAQEKSNEYWENYEYSSASQTLGTSQMNIGLALRMLCVTVLTFGLLLFVDDALSLGCGSLLLLLYALAVSAGFGAMMLGGKALLFGVVLVAVEFGISFLMHTAFFQYYGESIRYTFDAVMKLLVDRGYDNYSAYITGASGLGYSAVALYRGTMWLMAVVLGAIFSACLMRKTVLSPVLVFSLSILMLGFTYNLNSSNWGFAFTLLALFGAVAMRLFDARFKSKKSDRRNTAALGGFTAGAAMLLAFVAVLIPSAVIKEQWRDISFISKPVSVARDVVDSVISGDAPNLKDLGVIKNMDSYNSRDVSVKTLTFTGETVMTVRSSYNKNISVYLRGWIATEFDGESWQTVTNSQLAAYKNALRTVAEDAGYQLDGDAYDPDDMTEAFYDMVYKDALYVSPETGYANNYEKGYISLYLDIDMKLGVGTGNLLYIPAIASAKAGVMKYGNREKAYKHSFNSYFDGMYVTGWLNLVKRYTVLAYAPIMSDTEFGNKFSSALNYYQAMKTLMSMHHSGEYTDTELKELEERMLSELGIELSDGEGTYFDRYISMDNAERDQAYARYVTLVDVYTEYAENAYGAASKADSAAIRSIAASVAEELGEGAGTHSTVLAVVQYMLDNFSYSTTPKLPSSLSGYDAFLRETREGYCVQFATTVTLVLRELGITARYVEGYIAAGFKEDEETGERICDVTDEAAHAWVEVYYEGFGWLPYETVRKYARSYYGSAVSSGGSTSGGGTGGGSFSDIVIDGDVQPDDPTADVPPAVSEPEPENGVAGKVFVAVLVVAAFTVIGRIIFVKLRERSDDMLGKRRRMISDAVNGSLDGDELEQTAKNINSEIFKMFGIAGLEPERGELPVEYASRLEQSGEYVSEVPFTEIMNIIQKQEFGNGISKEELAVVAGYFEGLWKDVYASKNRFEQMWYRYVLCQL